MEYVSNPMTWSAIPMTIYVILFQRNRTKEQKNVIYPIYYQIYLNALLFLQISLLFGLLAGWTLLFPEYKYDDSGLSKGLLLIVIGFFTAFNNTCFLIILFLLLCIQRFLIFSTPERFHRYISGNWLKLLISIVYLEAFVILCVRAQCPERYACIFNNCSSSVFLIVSSVHFAITIIAPFLSLYFNYKVYRKVRILSHDISNARRTVELNIAIQSTPVIIFCAARSVMIFLIYMDLLQSSDIFEMFICRFPGPAYVFIPLSYIFGNIDRLKKIKRFIARAQHSAEVRPVSSTQSGDPIVMAVENQNNVVN